MTQEAVIAWTALYIAVGSMALICAALAVIVTTNDIVTGAWRPKATTRLDMVLCLPRIWLRWQLNYLKGAPVILVVAYLFAADVGLEVFGQV
jgi:hypothetical protein